MATDGRKSVQHIRQAEWMQIIAATTAHDFDEPTAAILPHADGNFTCTLAGDDTEGTHPLRQGIVYPFAVKSVPASNAIQFTALFNSAKG